MRIPGLKTLRQSARWMRSRFVKGALILGYHRVADVASDPFLICVSQEHFAEQLEIISRYAHPVSLQELTLGLQDKTLLPRAVAITFDDGYNDVLYHAKPLLEHYQIPATVLIATGYLGLEFWWDELERILSYPETLPGRLSLSFGSSSFHWSSRDTYPITDRREADELRQQLLISLYERLLHLSSDERRKVMDQLREWAGDGSNQVNHSRALTTDEVIQLVEDGIVDAGAHSVNHLILADLPVDEQRAEVVQSKNCLEEIIGKPVTSFSYPNGSYSKLTPAIVREAGFLCACTSKPDVVRRNSDQFQLPRFWIQDWDGDTFSRWLRLWLPD